MLMCRLYGVTRAGFYAWRSRERSERERHNEALASEIRVVHEQSRGTYGSPRVHQALRRRGHRVGKNRVARLMRRHGIKARVATIRYTNPAIQRYFDSVLNEQLDLELGRCRVEPDRVGQNDRPPSAAEVDARLVRPFRQGSPCRVSAVPPDSEPPRPILERDAIPVQNSNQALVADALGTALRSAFELLLPAEWH